MTLELQVSTKGGNMDMTSLKHHHEAFLQVTPTLSYKIRPAQLKWFGNVTDIAYGNLRFEQLLHLDLTLDMSRLEELTTDSQTCGL